MRPVAIISLVFIICLYLVLRVDPAQQLNTERTDGETTIQENNPPDSSSISSQVAAEFKLQQADSSVADIDSSTTQTGSDATDVIIIGNFKDPDDSSPLDREDKERISIGVVLDADNDEGWPPRENVTPISNGDVIDANAVGYENSAADKETISIGRPIDVEKFLADEYGYTLEQDTTLISIGEIIAIPD